ncbi:GTP-binding protein gtr2 [Didymosphaeria variabile]|uniref:GTP-binding protein gtr2 n=1 Tax=Didymosphaeria variabile TaxID=1932322 RepID=A0A9W9C9J2_9PLEO|nr:GTP-binding protein gtr2 [Didymosphaeria variabile]KAJ4351415.1 GTP-binding protein gtr2 [Didymosphaeria variabile]
MGQTYGVEGGKENAVEAAKLVMNRVKNRLESFEIGNEPDIFYLVGHRPENYSMAEYVSQWNEYADAVSEEVLKGNQYGLEERRFFQTGTFAGGKGWTVQKLLDAGIDRHKHTKSVSVHHYDGVGEPWIRLGSSLMNHTNIASNVSSLVPNIKASRNWTPSLPFILGETNSDASNLNFTQVIGVFGSALWLIDRTFLSMAANMRRQNLIQGTTFGYTAWVPVSRDGREPYVRPPLYGQIFTADAVGTHSEVQVYPMPASKPKFVSHAIYEAGKLARYALINFDEWNSTTPYERPSQSVELAVPRYIHKVQIERLTASGASADEGIEWAGQSWNYTDGRLVRHGKHIVEHVKARKGAVMLSVSSTEAVLVTLKQRAWS